MQSFLSAVPIAAVIAFLVASAACKPDPSTGNTGGSGGAGGAPATGGGGSAGGGGKVGTGFSCTGTPEHYQADVFPIFNAHCAGVEGCHIAMHDSAQAYAFLVNKPTDECGANPRIMIKPGDPENSYALQKMTDTDICKGSPMPKPNIGTWVELPAPFIQTVYDWVCEGAKND